MADYTDTQIKTLTKKDIEDKIRKRKKTYVGKEITVSDIITTRGAFTSTVFKKIEKIKSDFASEVRVDEDRIKMRLKESYPYYQPRIIFYVETLETDEIFEKRIKREIYDSWLRVLKRKRIIQSKELAAKYKKRKEAIKAIEYFGENIYDVFEELKKNETKTTAD